MRPLSIAPPAARLVLIIALAALAGGLSSIIAGREAAQAQQRPGQPLIPVEAIVHYGSRHVLPAAGGHSGSTESLLRVTNNGWEPTQVLVVELAAENPDCQSPFSARRIQTVHCHRDLARMHIAEIALSGEDSDVLIYSLDPAQHSDPCAAFEPVQTGGMSLAEWEEQVQFPGHGQPIAIAFYASGDGGRSASDAQPSLRVPDNLTRAIGGNLSLPVIGGDSGSGGRFFNASGACNTLQQRAGLASAMENCRPADAAALALGGFGSVSKPAEDRPGAMQVITQGGGDRPVDRPRGGSGNILGVASVADIKSAAGAERYQGMFVSGAESSVLKFPIAYLDLPGSQSELWISNLHVTATLTVKVVLYDAGGGVIRNFDDPVGLCAGASRSYDLIEIAGGEIPLVQNRGGRGGTRHLSLRIEATSPDLEVFAPVGGVVHMRSKLGDVAYSGVNVPALAAFLRGRRDQPPAEGATGIVKVVTDVKKNVGPQQISTMLNIVAPGINAPENTVSIDFYDDQGNLVVREFQRAMRPVAFFDLRAVAMRSGNDDTPPSRLPDGFVGTAVIRGQRNLVAPLGVVAIDLPGSDQSRQLEGDFLSARTGTLLINWEDPSIPTPTLRPTRPPTEVPTETPEPGSEWKIHLPMLHNGDADTD